MSTPTLSRTVGGASLTAEEIVGQYGPAYASRGVITEHVPAFEAAGGTVRDTATGRMWAVLPGGRAVPVLCSEVIAVDTEDGPVSGRCGAPAGVEDGRCIRH